MPRPPTAFKWPDVSRIAGQYDGEVAYMQEIQRYTSRVTELETRLRLAKISADTRTIDKIRTDLSTTIELIKDPVVDASDTLQDQINGLQSTMRGIKDDINAADTYGPVAMGMIEKREELSSSLGQLNNIIRTTFPDLDRVQNALLCEKLANVEEERDMLRLQLQEQRDKNSTEKSETIQGLYKRIGDLNTDMHGLADELQAADDTKRELEQKLADIDAQRQQDIADNETRVSRLIVEKSQFQDQTRILQSALETLSVSAGGGPLTEYLRIELDEARTGQKVLQSDIEAARREQDAMKERVWTMQQDSSSMQHTISVLTRELNSSKDQYIDAVDSNANLERETLQLRSNKKQLQDKVADLERSRDDLQDALRKSHDTLASQKHHFESTDKQMTVSSEQLILAKVRVDELEKLLEEKDLSTSRLKHEQAESALGLMQQVEAAKLEAATLVSTLNDQTSDNAKLQVQMQRTKKHLTRLRWLVVLRSVHLNVKTARIDLTMDLVGYYRQECINAERTLTRVVAIQCEGYVEEGAEGSMEV